VAAAAPDEPPPLEALKAKIAASRGGAGDAEGASPPKALNGANTYGYIADLFSGVAVGAGLGYVVDRQVGAMPAFTVLGLILGFAAGVMLIYKASMRESRQEAADKKIE